VRHVPGENYSELVEHVAIRQGITKRGAREVIEAFVVLLGELVWRKGRVRVPGLGDFTVKHMKARRIAKPPHLGPGAGFMVVKARRVVKCRVSPQWRTR